MTTPKTRHSLIVRLKNADNEMAWQDFVVAYEPFLRQLAVRQGVPERHVSDVTQQVLLAISRSIDGWKDDGQQASFRRWVSTVSRNVVVKFMTAEEYRNRLKHVEERQPEFNPECHQAELDNHLEYLKSCEEQLGHDADDGSDKGNETGDLFEP